MPKQRTQQESAALDAAIRKGIYANKSINKIAIELGESVSYLYTLLRRRLGFETMLLDEAEREIIKARRAKLHP